VPIYEVQSKRGTVSPEARLALVESITAIHAEETGAPIDFINVIFADLEFDSTYTGGKPSDPVFVRGQVRAGRPDEVRLAIMTRINDAVLAVVDVDPMRVAVVVEDLPSQWAMEAGHVLPEPDPAAEDAWFARVGARPA
jgi:phenylpyruvate tautomerase PptA (4-oxalocrotonate tautomerase family)